MTRESGAQLAGVGRPGALRALRGLAMLFGLLVLLQAALAGRGLYFNHHLIDIHGYVANFIFLVVIVQVALAFLAGIRGPRRSMVIGVNVLLLLLVLAQIGLGYSGRDEGHTAASIHIPNGVLIFGLAVFNISLVSRLLPGGGMMGD